MRSVLTRRHPRRIDKTSEIVVNALKTIYFNGGGLGGLYASFGWDKCRLEGSGENASVLRGGVW